MVFVFVSFFSFLYFFAFLFVVICLSETHGDYLRSFVEDCVGLVRVKKCHNNWLRLVHLTWHSQPHTHRFFALLNTIFSGSDSGIDTVLFHLPHCSSAPHVQGHGVRPLVLPK